MHSLTTFCIIFTTIGLPLVGYYIYKRNKGFWNSKESIDDFTPKF